jgi:hypothetical protein
MLDFWNMNPFSDLPKNVFDPQDGKNHWSDGDIIDRIRQAGFEPDVVFGWGSTGGRIRDALRNYGLNADVGFSGAFSAGWEELWARLQDYLSAGRPVPVMIDLGAIGGTWYTVHWAIAYKIADDRIYLGNCFTKSSPTLDEFLRAWHCWFNPYGFNHCAVYC